ncbi:MAG: ferrous iron transport protein A [Campylobacter sp.]|nr:ferrous iron transport protein A [Campylobacter sp.]
MSLNELKDGSVALITNINADDELKLRFFSLGVNENKKITKLRSSLGRATMEILVDSTCIILRHEEAEKISIQEL